MYKIYWTENGPQSEDINELKEALQFCEEKRKMQREGKNISFITLVSENPNSVGNPGADDVSADYDWKKRR